VLVPVAANGVISGALLDSAAVDHDVPSTPAHARSFAWSRHRHPLLLDPDGIAHKWIRAHEAALAEARGVLFSAINAGTPLCSPL
jgi:hypothetical protein